ncbi:MAG TPA: energy transducer TonB [Opitutales bacterium]|nr:energy transducer TonB [Opitutales bacterium]
MKKTMLIKGLLTIAALTLTGLSASAEPASGVNSADPTIAYMVEPIFPVRLAFDGTLDGSATIMVELDNTGKMTDWLALSTTNDEFVSAISHVIKEWKFEPAIRNGKPAPSAMSISFNFNRSGGVSTSTGVQFYNVFLNTVFNPVEKPLVARYSDLDALPRPKSVADPVLGSDIPEGQRSGEVVLGFFIDTNGGVRMPILLECKGDIRLAYAAYDAIFKWQFDVPRVNGTPMMVRAQQKFIFTEPPKKSSK